MSTPQQVAARIRERARKIPQELRRAEGEMLDTAKRQAQALSSGPYSTATLWRMGHPYRHGGRPPMDSGIINVQRGVFRRSWTRKLGAWRGGRLHSRLANASDVARFMRGTSKMIRRPIWRLIGITIRPVRRSKLRAALRRGLQI